MDEQFMAAFVDEMDKIAAGLAPGKIRRMDKTVRDFFAKLVKKQQTGKPGMIDPRASGGSERKGVGPRHSLRREDQVARFQVPPEVISSQGAGKGEDRRGESDREQKALVIKDLAYP